MRRHSVLKSITSWFNLLYLCNTRGESRVGAIGPLTFAKVTVFTMTFYNSENNMRVVRSFCRPLFCHSSFVKYIYPSYSSKAVMRLDYRILLKSTPPVTLMAGSTLCNTVQLDIIDQSRKNDYICTIWTYIRKWFWDSNSTLILPVLTFYESKM